MLLFVFNNILLGVGLAMDAFSVSLANGLHEPNMRTGRMSVIAGTFGGYQFAMPMIGWLCVHTIAQIFASFEKFIPWIALILLAYIGGSMLIEGIKDGKETKSSESAEETSVDSGASESTESAGSAEAAPQGGSEIRRLGFGALMIQGIATSIDALSVGFTIADYNALLAFAASVIIAITTYIICMGGLAIGKKAGTKLAGKASILGGCILIFIGLEIFVTHVFM